jgi:hypothetical protein
MSSPRIIAVDWSGAVAGPAKKIWLAEVDPIDKRVVRLEPGGRRELLVNNLIEESRANPNLVVGFDFAFSFPNWFLIEKQLPDAPALWGLVEIEGERWLSECSPPFWGRATTHRPTLEDHLRRTDRDVPAMRGIRPKSVFQISGAGAVGTGSIRGMPLLKRLRDAGFSVWPFDSANLPLVVEIYPRLLTGPVNKGDRDTRREYLEVNYPEIGDKVSELAASSEDAFDALVSALVMADHALEFASLGPAFDEIVRREGAIWHPNNTVADRVAPKPRPSSRPARPRELPASGLRERAVLTEGRAAKPSPTTRIGFTNRNGQRVTAKTSLQGSDHNQKVYVLTCIECGYVYGANGSDIHVRKCPRHQGGQPGEPLE